jgi:coenzyme F420-0:L-glutamate ligase / coenzyme F420-1:gamma-L-glutamate ligase
MTGNKGDGAISDQMQIFALPNIPAIQPGDDLCRMIIEYGPATHDIIVIAQKVISKSEGRIVHLGSVSPSQQAEDLALETGKDARVVELVLRESAKVLRAAPGLMIVQHRLGYIMANAGIDASNAGDEDQVILLPENPDRSARQMADAIKDQTDVDVGIIISDSWGRPWRLGTAGFAIGLAGVQSVIDMRGTPDLDGRALQATSIGVGDELAAAASLLMGQANEGRPVVVIRGLQLQSNESCAQDLVRPAEEDLFR